MLWSRQVSNLQGHHHNVGSSSGLITIVVMTLFSSVITFCRVHCPFHNGCLTIAAFCQGSRGQLGCTAAVPSRSISTVCPGVYRVKAGAIRCVAFSKCPQCPPGHVSVHGPHGPSGKALNRGAERPAEDQEKLILLPAFCFVIVNFHNMRLPSSC